MTTANGSAEGDAGGDDCALLTDAEIEAATEVAPISHESPSIGRGCTWQDDEDDISLVALEILDDDTFVSLLVGDRGVVEEGEVAGLMKLVLERL